MISRAKIVDLDSSRIYFHWGDETTSARWLSQGINDSEFQSMSGTPSPAGTIHKQLPASARAVNFWGILEAKLVKESL